MKRHLLLGVLLQSGCTLLFFPRCGDGFAQLSEDCDDGNSIDADGCESDCTFTPSFCGDGALDEGESCDDGNANNGDGCDSDCEVEVVCGDGVVTAPEQCDDSNTISGDGCSGDCSKIELCGDSLVDEGEECDDDNNTDGDGCDSDCSFTRCKNGISISGELCLNAPQLLETFSPPQKLAVGDLNEDDLPDLVITSNAGLRVFLKDPRGFFTPAIAPNVGQQPGGVAIGDINNDSDLDIVTANTAGNSVSVIFGDGDGGFGLAQDLDANVAPDSVLLADFDRDSQLDIAATGTSSGDVGFIFRAVGGGFETMASLPVLAGPRELTAGDFDEDGFLDLAVACQSSSQVSLLLGDGARGFSLSSFLVQVNGQNGNPNGVTSADLDGDQHLDLIVSNGGTGSTATSVFFGDGSGVFSGQLDLLGGLGPFSSATGDLNQDGLLDIVTTNSAAGSISVSLNQGVRSFAASTQIAVGRAPRGLLLADLDRDARLDLALALTQEDQALVLSGLEGGFQVTPFFDTNTQTTTMALDDFDTDGEDDLVVINSDAAARSFIGDGEGSFVEGDFLLTGVGAFGVATGELTGDGFTDIIISNFGTIGAPDDGALRLYPGLDGGSFGTEIIIPLLDGADGVVIAELDTVAGNDIAVTNFLQDTVDLLSFDEASGNFVAAPLASGVGGEPLLMSSGDFDGDLDIDLVVSNFTAGTVTPIINIGDGTFFVGTPITSCTKPQTIVVRDLNSDGIEDLVVGCEGAFAILHGTETSFLFVDTRALGVGPSAVTVDDVNNDGRVDIIAASEGVVAANPAVARPGNIRVFLQEANGSFVLPVVYRTSLGSNFIVSGDFNSDGLFDLVTTQRTSRGLDLFLSAP